MGRSRKWKNKPPEIRAKARAEKMDRQIAAISRIALAPFDAGVFNLAAQAQRMRRLTAAIGGPLTRGGRR